MNGFEQLVLGFTVYFFTANCIFLILLVASFISMRRFHRLAPLVQSLWESSERLGPAISVIAPCFNEQETIVDSVYSFLALNYHRLEIIIVSDGSVDASISLLKAEFELQAEQIFYDDQLSKTGIRATYRSLRCPNLIVIDKDHSGKADSLNVGIGFAQYDYVCCVDSDSILDRDALIKVIVPFVEDPMGTVAAGGSVRPSNGAKIVRGDLRELTLPWHPLALFQIVEYLRAFLLGRVGWNLFDATMIISGSFGLFQKEAVTDAGGFLADTVGEDMELVVRLRRWSKEHDRPGRISFVPDPICWTEVPMTLRSLGRQRHRWQRGLADSLFKHRSLLFNPKYGAVAFFAYPYFLVIELLGPLVEVIAYPLIFWGYLQGWVDGEVLRLVLVADILFGTLMSFGAVLIEELIFNKYPLFTQRLVLLTFSLLENLGFRQFNAIWRLFGTAAYFWGDRGWHKVSRRA